MNPDGGMDVNTPFCLSMPCPITSSLLKTSGTVIISLLVPSMPAFSAVMRAPICGALKSLTLAAVIPFVSAHVYGHMVFGPVFAVKLTKLLNGVPPFMSSHMLLYASIAVTVTITGMPAVTGPIGADTPSLPNSVCLTFIGGVVLLDIEPPGSAVMYCCPVTPDLLNTMPAADTNEPAVIVT